MRTIRESLIMVFTDPLELREVDPLQADRYAGAYPDIYMPLDRHPRISEVFYTNTPPMPNNNFPLTLIFIPEWKREHHTCSE